MSDEKAKMRALFARAKATRETDDPPADSTFAAGFEVPRCSHCGAPREASQGQARGALASVCRFCGKA